MNIVLILVVSVFIVFVISVLKVLIKMILFKRPSKRRRHKRRSSRKKANIRAHSLNHRILTASTYRYYNNQRTSFNMNTLQYKLDKPDVFMLFKRLYNYMKTRNSSLPVENVYSCDDSD